MVKFMINYRICGSVRRPPVSCGRSGQLPTVGGVQVIRYAAQKTDTQSIRPKIAFKGDRKQTMILAAGLILFRGAVPNIEYLLLKHSKGGHWALPKGHKDPGEDDRDAAIRETDEETGLESTDYRIIPNFRAESKYMVKKGEKTVVFFLAEMITKNPQIKLSHEHSDFAWLSLKEAVERISNEHESTKAILQMATEFLEKDHK